MQLNITGHSVELTEALHNFMGNKFMRLEQHFKIYQAHIVLKAEKTIYIVDATLHLNGGKLHASAEGQDIYAAIDILINKLARQLNKHKEKFKQH